MPKHKIERTVPTDCRVPGSTSQHPKFRTIICDPPWTPSRASGKDSGYIGAINHYPPMSLERIKAKHIRKEIKCQS